MSASLNDPLQVTPTTFICGHDNTMVVNGSGFSSSNVVGIVLSTNFMGVSWGPANYSVLNSSQIQIVAKPIYRDDKLGDPMGDLTVTLSSTTGTQTVKNSMGNPITYVVTPPPAGE